MNRRDDDNSRGVRRGPGPYLTCGAIATTILGLATMKSRSELDSAERTLATARAQVDVVTGAEKVAVEMQVRITELRADLADYARLREPGAMAAVFATLVDALPEAVALDGISIERGPGSYTAEVLGSGDDQALALLRRSLSRSVSLSLLEPGARSNASDGSETFRLHLRFDPGAMHCAPRDGASESIASVSSEVGS